MERELTTKLINQQRDRMHLNISKLMKHELLKAMKEFKKLYPKKKIGFTSGMGTAFFTIDGCIVDYDYNSLEILDYSKTFHLNNTDKLKQLLNCLVSFLDWLNSVLERHEYLDHYLEDVEPF